jgi:hypothetical protein
MRYAIVILLLASPAVAGDPAYSWRTRADDPDRVYLYLDGNQIGGWDYKAKQYRSYDGKDWGPPTAMSPVTPPMKSKVITLPTPPTIVITEPLSPLPPLRGPFKVRLGTAMGYVMADMTMKMVEAIPRAMLESLKEAAKQSLKKQ